MGKRGHSALKGYKYSDFKEILNKEGFFEHHKNSSHMVFANSERYYITVPCGHREINHMMTTISLQRIKNGQCRKMSEIEYETLKQF
jgi:predicted RNA binding protein YcfA (HicA-like mRNA interferase family)